jgi:hypothetical protein
MVVNLEVLLSKLCRIVFYILLSSRSLLHIFLHLDNQTVLYSISRPSVSSSARLIREIVAATAILEAQSTTIFVGWVPGHSGILGNDLADNAAKFAATLPPDNSLPWTPTGIRPTIRSQLLIDWMSSVQQRADYPYHPTLEPGPLFDLPRMQASRLFQMRLGKSYLLGHTNWVHPDPEPCPLCNMELETMEHALLTCSARDYARDQFPPDLTLAEAWSSPDILKILGNYITYTRTGYPPSPPSSPAPSPVSQTFSTF